ncbi:MAG: hypothetical protein IJG13_20580 [Kiritimatiellae bacterium]|nr:hypothetical protein [Kiritimatiellia bacterium]
MEIESTADLLERALANRSAPVREFVVLALSAAMAFAAGATPFRLDLSAATAFAAAARAGEVFERAAGKVTCAR